MTLKYNFVPTDDHLFMTYSDVLEHYPNSFLPAKLVKWFNWTDLSFNTVKRNLQDPKAQNYLISFLKPQVPKTLIQSLIRLKVGVDAKQLKQAIHEYLRRQYNANSLFDQDVNAMVRQQANRWKQLTDTNVREHLKDIYNELYIVGSTVRVRMVFAYDTGKDQTPVSNKVLENQFRSKQFLNNMNHAVNISALSRYKDGHEYDVTLHLTPSQIKRVKIFPSPVRQDTGWEAFTRKYHGPLHNPERVVVLDVETVLVSQQLSVEFEKIGAPPLVYNQHFLNKYKHEITRVLYAQGGWLSNKYESISLVQIGDWSVKPDYRKFDIGTYKE
jgi:hypothetical protein